VEDELPALARWVEALAPSGVVWAITADHGEGFDAERGRVHHGGRLHDDLLRVPLILKATGRLAPGQGIDAPVRTIDVAPTLLDLAGLPLPSGLAGESLLPALRGAAPFPASAFAEERAHGLELLAVRREGWKWIRGPHHAELYHLSADPLERDARPGEPPAELDAELATFPERYPVRASGTVELDEATLEHLRALGYVH
jgi:arylsulfatase A-like enzyme